MLGSGSRANRPASILFRAAAALLLSAALSGCGTPAPASSASDAPAQPAALQPTCARMADGYRLPLRQWGGAEEPQQVVLGLHGFNDYSRAFAPLGRTLAEHGITTYAIDQRGFGATEQAGRWHGSARLQADLRALIGLLRARHPQARLLVAGESMGAAVVLAAANRAPLAIDGLILIAPALWSRATMPWYQRLALTLAAHTLPGLELTGEGVARSPTDNRRLLRRMSRDPLVIKATRVDALWGVTNLMDQAAAWPPSPQRRTPIPTLILYGEQDQIIPPQAFCRFIVRLPLAAPTRLLLYADGWHMLPRDLQGERVRRDIAHWLQHPDAALPSGEEVGVGHERLRRFCRAASRHLGRRHRAAPSP